MKKLTPYWLGACFLCATSVLTPKVFASSVDGMPSLSVTDVCSDKFLSQSVGLQPVPQEVVMGSRQIVCPSVYQLIGAQAANLRAVALLKELLPGNQHAKEGFRIYIGEKEDKHMRKYRRHIPAQEEGYYLSVGAKEIVIAGSDERGTFYALQTLSQLLNKDNNSLTLPEVTIKDYPAVRYRGVVEGFYGTPWSHAARLRQLRFYGENKMNTYIYGPKDDPYHSCPNWRRPYPEKEAAQLKELVQVAADNEVDFVWAIHPGQDIKWNEEDRALLLSKFESMYALGVRSFAVFFDDISGEGTNALKQAELLNYIDNQFVKVKGDVTPLIMCPTEYNKSWSNPKGNYLTTLGEKLNPSIKIMWTGDRVVADISQESMKWINERIQRPAYIWWNFPVSDYVRDHLLLGPVYGNDTTIASDMSGFVTNPMEHAEASKIAIYGVANYAWNPQRFESVPTWKKAIQTVLPDAAAELEFFAAHNSDLGLNGHKYRREESVDVRPVAERFLQAVKAGHPIYLDASKAALSSLSYAVADASDARTMQSTFLRMQEVADILQVNTCNKPLIEEIKPWLYQFKLMGEIGELVLQLYDVQQNIGWQQKEAVSADEQKLVLQKEKFLQIYRHIQALQRQIFVNNQIYNCNDYQPGMRPASLVIKPFIDELFVLAVERYNRLTESKLDAIVDYCPHKLTSNVPQIKHLPLQAKGGQVLITPSNEVIRWGAGQQVVIELDAVYPLVDLMVNFFKNEPCSWGRFEVSVDGKEWHTVPHVHQGVRQHVTFKGVSARFVRFTNISQEDKEVFLRQFLLRLK